MGMEWEKMESLIFHLILFFYFLILSLLRIRKRKITILKLSDCLIEQIKTLK